MPTTMPTAVLLFAATVATLGAGLFFFGWRGRRVGDHPFCRRCGFDLFGKPDDSRVCTECGSPLDRRRAIVIGERRRRRWAIALGAALLVPAIAALSVFGYAAARDTDWQSHKPV